MKQFTYLFDFQHVSETGRRWAMHEFAQLGAKHLVLTDTLIAMIMQNPTLQKTLADELAGEGLTFVDAHSPFGKERDLLTPYAESRPQMLARHRLAMQIAADLGVDTITIHVGNPNWFDTNVFPLNKSMELIRDALDALLPVAEDLGLTICIENIWYPTSTPDKLLEIKSFFPTDALGFTYDAGHANLMDKGRNYDESNAQKGWADSGFANVPWEDKALEKNAPACRKLPPPRQLRPKGRTPLPRPRQHRLATHPRTPEDRAATPQSPERGHSRHLPRGHRHHRRRLPRTPHPQARRQLQQSPSSTSSNS